MIIDSFIADYVAAAEPDRLAWLLARLPMSGRLPDSFWDGLGIPMPDTLSSLATPLLRLQRAAARRELRAALGRMSASERAGIARSHTRKYWRDRLGSPGRVAEARRQALVFVLFLAPGWVCSPAWRSDTVRQLARQMHESSDFWAMPILADALQEAGCDNAEWLSLMRERDTPWCRGAHVLDDLRS